VRTRVNNTTRHTMMTADAFTRHPFTRHVNVTQFLEYSDNYHHDMGHTTVSYFVGIARIAFTLLLTQHIIMQFFLFVNVMWLYYRYFRLRNEMFDRDIAAFNNDHRREYVLTKSEFQQLPHLKVKAENDGERCPICLCEYIRDQRLRVLPCSHYYHTRCIERWLTKMNTVCPLCRYDLIQFVDHDVDDDN
jgi:hypothetical protein